MGNLSRTVGFLGCFALLAFLQAFLGCSGNQNSATAPVTVFQPVTILATATFTPTGSPTLTRTITPTPTVTGTPTPLPTPVPTTGIFFYQDPNNGGSAVVDSDGVFTVGLYVDANAAPSSSLGVTFMGPGGTEAVPFLNTASNAFGGYTFAHYAKTLSQTCVASAAYTITIDGSSVGAGAATITANMPGPININLNGQAVTWINTYSYPGLNGIQIFDITAEQLVENLGPGLVSPVSISPAVYATTDNYQMLVALTSSDVAISGAGAGSNIIFTNTRGRAVTLDPLATPTPGPAGTWNIEMN